MRVPNRAEFPELAQVIERFGLPDALAILPELENQLEAVDGSNAQVREVATGMRGIADDLTAEAGKVDWRGEAADQFRSKTAEIAGSLRDAADKVDAAVTEVGKLGPEFWSVIWAIVKALIIAGTFAAALITLAMATTPAGLALGTILLIVALLGIALGYKDLFELRANSAIGILEAIIAWIIDLFTDDPEHPKVA